jgi:hypothetical protein
MARRPESPSQGFGNVDELQIQVGGDPKATCEALLLDHHLR